MSTFTFTWPKGPQEVILTGTFDNWGKTLPLVKQADGSFELTVPLPSTEEKLLYKYVVDGEWSVSKTQSITKDESGIENNYIDAKDLVSTSSTKNVIPESGLPVAAVAAATTAAAAGVAAASASAPKDDVKTTVMPKEAPSHPTIAGEPGIFVPKDAEALEAFKTVSDVDPKTLNGAEVESAPVVPELTAEEKKKQKKKVKKSKYKAKKKGKKTEGEPSTSEEQTPEPESVPVIAPLTPAAPVAPVEPVAPVAPVESVEPVEPVAAVEPVAPVEPVESVAPVEPVVAKEEVIPVVAVVEPVVVEEAHHTLDPKAVEVPEPTVEEHPAPSVEKTAVVETEKEVDASPVKAEEVDPVATEEVAPVAETPAKKAVEDSEEIVITQGNISNPKEAIVAAEGDVIVEEIKPTESEAARLTKEANIPEQETTTAATTPATATKVKTAPVKKEEPKKKVGFFSKLKKIFK